LMYTRIIILMSKEEVGGLGLLLKLLKTIFIIVNS
jgi:hypothetical protein